MWIKLTDLPGSRLTSGGPDHLLIFWEIQGGKIIHQGRVNRKACADDFEILDGQDFVARDAENVYFGWKRIIDADRDTFELLGNGYFKDKSRGYFWFESIKTLKGGLCGGLEVLGGGYACDNKYAYWFGRVLSKCTTPRSFRLAPCISTLSSNFALDSNHVYFERAALIGANPVTWREVERGFSMDANSVFFGAKKLAGATPDNWKLIQHPYSTNGKKIYSMWFALEGPDLSSFEVLPDGSCRDKFSAFSGKKRV